MTDRHEGRRGRAPTPTVHSGSQERAWAMWLFVVIGVIGLVAIVGTALGQVWGPLLLALGFAAWGVLMLLSGFRNPFPQIGVLYLTACILELSAAWQFWQPVSPKGPSTSWRLGATSIGVAGVLGAIVLLGVMVSAMVSAMII